MEQFVLSMIECFNNRDRADMNSFIPDVPEDIDMRHVLLKILPWLRLEYKRYEWKKSKHYITSRPLKLCPQYKWGRDIIRLIEENEAFAKFFHIADNELYINQSISEEEKRAALLAVFNNYVPLLIR